MSQSSQNTVSIVGIPDYMRKENMIKSGTDKRNERVNTNSQ